MRPFLLPLLALPLLAVEPTATLDRFLLANRLRTDQARERASHVAERQRLEALVAATEAATARADQESQAAEDRAADLVRQAGQMPSVTDLDQALATAVDQLEVVLGAVARHLPPGTLPPAAPAGAVPTIRSDAAVARLEAAERAAATVSVAVVTGRWDDGTAQAVKVLRVGGSASWWLALDGRHAGLTTLAEDGTVHLHPRPEALAAITAAVAQAEGREAPGVVLLPTGGQP